MKQARYFDARRALIVLLLVTAPGAAMAYIDPGSGAYMVQAVFTVVAAALFYARHPIRTLQAIWRWMSGRSTNNSLPQNAESAEPELQIPAESPQGKISSGEP
jgi:hypothetical protein